MTEQNNRRVRVVDVVRAAERAYELEPGTLASSSRRSIHVGPRQMAAYVARHRTRASFAQIGAALGGRDHTTVMHGVRKIAEMVGRCPDLGHQADHVWTLAVRGLEPRGLPLAGKCDPGGSATPATKTPALPPPQAPPVGIRIAATAAVLRGEVDRLEKSAAARNPFSPEWYRLNNARFALGLTAAMTGGAV